jgi:hypothetical protein
MKKPIVLQISAILFFTISGALIGTKKKNSEESRSSKAGLLPLTSQFSLNVALLRAAQENNSEKIAALLSTEAQIMPLDLYREKSYLSSAIEAGTLETLTMLLKAGVNPNTACPILQIKPLEQLLSKSKPSFSMYKSLLKHGAHVNFWDQIADVQKDRKGNNLVKTQNSTIFKAITQKIDGHSLVDQDPRFFSYALRSGASIASAIPEQQDLMKKLFPQPLLQAIFLRDSKQIREILSNSSPENARDIIPESKECSALVYAAAQGYLRAIMLLLRDPVYGTNIGSVRKALCATASCLRNSEQPEKRVLIYQTIGRVLTKRAEKLSC